MIDRQWISRPFIGWDGEGVTRADGEHDYVLLANSNGERITSQTYLPTADILSFVLLHSQPKTINVIYGAGYDFNCWLRDLSIEQLQELYSEGETRFQGFLLRWRRGKSLHIMRNGTSAMFYDVISFFQTSFVNACDSYLGERFVDRELIVENKRLRSSFRPSDIDDIITYNDAELVNLVELMNNLRERLYRVGLKPTRWDGPGAVAVSLMRREGIKDHKQDHPERIMPAIRHAYYGGRFEVIKFGHWDKPAYEYDVNSAYPYAIQNLPSLNGGHWQYVKGDAGPHPYALYMVEYDGRGVMRPDRPQPLPRRHKDGTVTYPLRVKGWYWSPEIETAREYVRLYGGKLTFTATWVFKPASSEKPFAFVPALYEQRRALKAAKDGAHVGIKLGLNSLYGKLAQQVGWRLSDDGVPILPPYHQLDWAGYVTATCRSLVLGAVLPDLDNVIAWETDAVFTVKPLTNITLGEGLGEWEETQFANLTYLQSGVYYADAINAKSDKLDTVEKSRGVDKGELHREKIMSALSANETHVPAKLTRFTGAGLALQLGFEKWRRWETMTKQVALYPNGKRVHVGCGTCRPGQFVMGDFHTTETATRPGYHSAEYAVGWVERSDEIEDLRNSHYEELSFSD